MDNSEDKLTLIEPSKRILLLPHCLRRSATCQGKYTEWGLQCQECDPECPVNRLRQAAIAHGYKGVCVAPGGRLAVKYVKKIRPEAIIAVACEKELEEGIRGVHRINGEDISNIVISVIPLMKDGCVDTEADEEKALEIIATGCARDYIKEGVQ